ncbi:unnamed protein product [Ambrosiozyma monospora]|uniref:Unnamed protein product n=1 Tax=Ambrosiozyma monospora TaxID=43982 RepID=A0ACB5TB61_AMBMO|nr:unnamed protein product [Ambrosiozyma monospora]
MIKTKLEVTTKKGDELYSQIRKLNQYKVDLQRQVAILLAQLTFKNGGSSPLTREEKEYLKKLVGSPDDTDLTDTDRLITERLVAFRDISDLIAKNEQLLTISRDLGQQLEKRDQNSQNLLEDGENEAVSKATEAIVKLKSQLHSTETQLKAVKDNRDMLQQMIENGQNYPSQGRSEAAEKFLNERIEALKSELKSKQTELKSLKKSTDTQIFELNTKIQTLTTEKSNVALELARTKSSLKLLEQKSKSTEYLYTASKAEAQQLHANSSKLQENLTKLELRSQKLSDELIQSRSAQANLEVQLKGFASEKSVWESIEKRLRGEIVQLLDEKAKLNSTIIKFQTLSSERETSNSRTTPVVKKSNVFYIPRMLILKSISKELTLWSLNYQLSVNHWWLNLQPLRN